MRTRSEPALLDRQGERAALDGLLGALRSGAGAALVVRGEAGVGKSALLEYVAGAAAEMRVVRVSGVESEMELAFAGLHQLCAPLLDRVDRLPTPQRDALEVAFGQRIGRRVRDRILAETNSNPLALLELPRGLSPTQLAGGAGARSGPLSAGFAWLASWPACCLFST